MLGAITHQLYLACTSNPKIDISDSRAVVQYVEHPYTTCSFKLCALTTLKMVSWKETVMCVWSHNPPILARMQLYM